LLRTLFSMVSATAFLLPFNPPSWVAMTLAMPVFTIKSSRDRLSKGEIFLGSSASINQLQISVWQGVTPSKPCYIADNGIIGIMQLPHKNANLDS